MINKDLNNYNGYIEGFYGKLLSWDDRNLIIKKLNKNKMNSYFYAPKEDIYHRFLWRKLYDKEWLNNFKNFCEFSKSKKISILAGVSPGLDFRFHNKNTFNKDMSILKNKFSKLLENGASKIVLLLDDIPNDFNKKFSKLDEGIEHAKLCNEINKEFQNNLIVIPRVYADELINESKDYLKSFLKELSDDIPLFYTGEYIISYQHNSKNKHVKKKIINNEVIFWDNFYANDYCPNKFFLGWPQFKNNKKNIMFNLTGMINTDLLLLDIINAYFLNQKKSSLKKILNKHGVPEVFFKLYFFFNRPINLKKITLQKFKYKNSLLNSLDFLLWNWKSPLAREWYAFLFNLKCDLQIYNKELKFEKIVKTQTIPIQNKLNNLKE